MLALNDTPAGDNGDLSEALEARLSELRVELETFEKRVERQTATDAAERRVAGTPADAGKRSLPLERQQWWPYSPHAAGQRTAPESADRPPA